MCEMDLHNDLSQVSQKVEKGELINPRKFMDSWPTTVHKSILIKSENEDQILSNIQLSSGMSEERVKELAEVCGKNTVYQERIIPKEKTKILLNSELPDDVDLECVRHQIWHNDLRQKSKNVKVSLFRRMKYYCLDEYLALTNCSTPPLDPEFQVPTPNVVLTVQVAKCLLSDMPAHTMKERETYLVLGSQYLSELKDKIKCSSDATIPGDYSAYPDLNPSSLQKAGDLFKSSCFFINNVFYNDTRLPDNADYSRPIIQWAKENMPTEKMTTANMQDVQFFDLNFKFGQNHLYIHQGNCEHSVIITDLRLLTSDDNQDLRAYPILSVTRSKSRAVCYGCVKLSAKWVVRNSPLIPTDPTFLCHPCFKSLLYTKDGKKVSNFQAYHLSQYYL